MAHIFRLFLVLALLSPVFAHAEGKKEGKGAGNVIKAEWTIKNDAVSENKTEDKANTLHAVDIPVVVAPISINGRLVNYAFINIRVTLKDDVDVWKKRALAHFMRDALVRMAHSHPLGKDGEHSQVDESRSITLIGEAIAPWISTAELDHISLLSVDMLNG